MASQTQPNAAQQPTQTQDPDKQKQAAFDAANKKKDSCHRIVNTFLTKFYGREAVAAIQGSDLWHLVKTPRGLLASLYNLESNEVKNYAIPVGTHKRHMPSAAADGLLKEWDALVQSGALRS